MKDVVYLPDVIAIGETPKALLVRVEGEEKWLPKSVIDDNSEVYEKGNEGTLIIAEWFANKEGLG